MSNIFGERLQQARKMRGLSLGVLSAELGGLVSKNALSKYEKGQMRPGSQVLLALSKRFDLRPDYFFEERPIRFEKVEFRKKSRLRKGDRERIEEEAREYFERYQEVERILQVEVPPLPTCDLRDTAPADLGAGAEAAADQFRAQWRLGVDPLANIQEMLEDRGVKVMEVEADSSFDGFAGWADGTPVIVLAKWLNGDLPRKRMTALHELGHLALALPEGLEKKEEESLNYRFAGAMLVPQEEFKKAYGPKRPYSHISWEELKAIKAQWGISIGAIIKRAHQRDRISNESCKQFWMFYKSRGWHRNEPGEWVGSERSHRFIQLTHRAAAQELITQSKAAGLLGISLDAFRQQFGSQD